MRVVFLDIDGVLFTKKSSQAFAAAMAAGKAFPCDDDMVTAFDAPAVQNVRHLIERTDARVVVSSTWRLRSSPARLASLLGRKGIGPVVGVTGRQRPTRGREIMEWLQAHPALTGFVILDDMNDELDTLFPDQHVRCDPAVGFGAPDALQRALDILGPLDAGHPPASGERGH